MSGEFNFEVIEANGPVEPQQSAMRQIVAARINLAEFALVKPARAVAQAA
jgi:hypothetical protein